MSLLLEQSRESALKGAPTLSKPIHAIGTRASPYQRLVLAIGRYIGEGFDDARRDTLDFT